MQCIDSTTLTIKFDTLIFIKRFSVIILELLQWHQLTGHIIMLIMQSHWYSYLWSNVYTLTQSAIPHDIGYRNAAVWLDLNLIVFNHGLVLLEVFSLQLALSFLGQCLWKRKSKWVRDTIRFYGEFDVHIVHLSCIIQSEPTLCHDDSLQQHRRGGVFLTNMSYISLHTLQHTFTGRLTALF